jgi:hypothetical protein
VNTEELEIIKEIMLTCFLKKKINQKTNQKTTNNQKARGNIF